LNLRDPLWRDKMRTRKLEEIKRMEQNREKLGSELQKRQREFEEEQRLNEEIRRMQSEQDY